MSKSKGYKITVGQYQELLLSGEFSGNISRMIHQICIIDDIDPNDLYELDDFEEIYDRYDEIKWINSPINTSKSKNLIDIEGNKLSLIDFNKINFGQFIDLEKLYSENFNQNISKIVASIYFMCEKKPLCEVEYERYSNIDVYERAMIIEDIIMIEDVYGSIIKYDKFRKNIFEVFSGLFDEPDDINVDELNEEELKIYQEEKDRAEKNRKNIWFDLLDTLADGDITKYDKVLDTNVYIVFNKLSKIRQDNLKAMKRNQTNKNK